MDGAYRAYRARYQYNYGQRQLAEILLILQILIRREKYIKARSGGTQQFTVFQSGPTTIGYC